ncbi:MAG: GWxTD domain-containing protein [Candidatus Aminicenantes bacterium]|nr:MAG: GWxTD domain-containing protein [Candidatus Aminicenantes bacterium]
MNVNKKGIVIFLILCFSACSLKLMPSRDPWYAKHYIIMQDFEWDAYKQLSKEGKTQFQELFWTVRDPKAQALFTSRLDIVIKSFKTENRSTPWNTDRGRTFLLNGNPAEVRYADNTDLGGIVVVPTGGEGGGGLYGVNRERSNEDIGARQSELWVYPYMSYRITYQFNFAQPRQWKFSPKLSESSFREELELYNRQVTYGILDIKKYQEQLEELKKIK